ncbi:MAG: ribonuclease Z [Flavobacteriales bacterium]|nr:ribonuclease Z [Flavobacteriales bacterium]
MKPFGLTVLGSSSALPTSSRNPSAHVLTLHDRLFLIDCGEGTQIQLRRYRIRMQKIQHIFISHLHGDHFLGLPGLISTMGLLGRTNPLTIFGPESLKEILDVQIKHLDAHLGFELHYHAVAPQTGIVLIDDDTVNVTTIALNHRIPCTGFLFKEKPARPNIRKEAIRKYDIPVDAIGSIKDGAPYTTSEGKIIPNSELVIPPPLPRSFAYCSDTAYSESIIDVIHGVDLLYHEATFTSDLEDRARETHHSTAAQAAEIARKAEVRQLVIGHFSARYKDATPLLNEARTIFSDTLLAEEGQHYPVDVVVTQSAENGTL